MLLAAAEPPFPGEQSDFHGFPMVHDAEAGWRVVLPKKPAPGRPWVWRARFWGHEPQVDVALLERGFHIAFCDVGNLFGSPRAIEIGDAFYASLVDEHGLAAKPVLEGMSRGGLFIYNWAAANPDKVTAIYGDAPVMDIKSWPGGREAGKSGPGAAAAWKACLAAERYRALGGTFRVIHKPGIGHHPHSLENPAAIVAFIMAAWTREFSRAAKPPPGVPVGKLQRGRAAGR